MITTLAYCTKLTNRDQQVSENFETREIGQRYRRQRSPHIVSLLVVSSSTCSRLSNASGLDIM